MLTAIMIITAIAAGYCFGRAHAATLGVPDTARTARPAETDDHGRTFDERMAAIREAGQGLDRTLDRHESAIDDLVSSYAHINVQLNEQRKLIEELRAMLQEHDNRMYIRISKLAGLTVSPE